MASAAATAAERPGLCGQISQKLPFIVHLPCRFLSGNHRASGSRRAHRILHLKN
jgi:hypothetical protein